MSDANDSKDLDKYGVWVKDAPKDIKGEDLPENALDDIDLPSDDDMFKDIDFPMTAEDLKEPAVENEISDLDINVDLADDNSDTTLSPDELSNITGDVEGADENADTTLSPDELSNITGEMEGADENADTTLSPDELLNITDNQEIKTEEAAEQGTDEMDDFNLDSLDITADESPAPAPAESEEPAESAQEAASEEVSLDDMPDGEIDLDDFMSDSGSGGGDAAAAPDGDVDLSAFMDGDDGDVDLSAFMDDAPAKKEPKPEEIQDEKSLDIDISFDDSADQIAQEDTSDDSDAQPEAEAAADESALPSDDMFDSFGGESPAPKAAASSADDSEEIDLSDFGFDDDDSNIGMTAGPDGGEQAKQEVVDYDMKVNADDDSKTPSVQDVVMGNIESSDDTEIEEKAAVDQTGGESAASEGGFEINAKGQEILSQIMGELSSLKDEIKNLKTDFAELKDRPTLAAENASIPAAKTEVEKEENTGFFSGDDDGDDTIALSGNELTNILSSAEFSTEEAVSEPTVEESAEPEFEETAIGEEEPTMELTESDMEEPTIDTSEITPEDLAGTTDEFGEENVLPEEISVPKIDDDITVESSSSDLMDSVVNTDEDFGEEPQPQEQLNSEAVDELLQEDIPISESLDEEKINYMESDVVSVDDIVKENVALDKSDDDVSIGVGDDINAAFDEADATESDIADTALAEKDAYENSVSEIMKENISLQEDGGDDVSIGVGDDINAAFDEADATESDIADTALAEKDAYENSKSLEEEFNLDDGESEENIPETLDPSVLAAPAEESANDEIDMSIFDEPVAEEPTVAQEDETAAAMEETAVEEPTIEDTVAAVPAPTPSAAPDTTTISKDLKTEIVSVLSYMDQLLENLPEDKITEFAKSEHFVTYKKLFDELGLS